MVLTNIYLVHINEIHDFKSRLVMIGRRHNLDCLHFNVGEGKLFVLLMWIMGVWSPCRTMLVVQYVSMFTIPTKSRHQVFCARQLAYYQRTTKQPDIL